MTHEYDFSYLVKEKNTATWALVRMKNARSEMKMFDKHYFLNYKVQRACVVSVTICIGFYIKPLKPWCLMFDELNKAKSEEGLSKHFKFFEYFKSCQVIWAHSFYKPLSCIFDTTF